jgi:hypothetical protein
MELKDTILIAIAILGWAWGIIQFVINYRNQKNDKIIERKYLAYSKYMKQVDEIMNNIRNNPNMIYGISTEFMQSMISGNETDINSALITFNEKLINFVKQSSEPLIIVKQELNALLLVCSKELKDKIDVLIELVTDFNND